MEFKYLPKDILSPIFSLVDPEDLVWFGLCGDKEFMERLSKEVGLVSSVILTGRLGPGSAESSFPFSALSTPAFSSLTRFVIHYEAEDESSWLWDPCFLPSTLTEIDFSFYNAFEIFLQPSSRDGNPHWMLQPMYSNSQPPPSEQLFIPMLLCDTFPELEKLRISGSALFTPKKGFPMHWGVKRPYRDLQHPTLVVEVIWTKAMLWLFLKKLPSSLTILDLSISADTLDEVPELPPNLTSLRYCEGVAPATHTPRFWLKLPESHRPDLSTLSNFQWDHFYSNGLAMDKFASEIELFNSIRYLDISQVELQSVADLKLLPRCLTQLKFNFHHTHRGALNMSDVSILPRTITHLTLLQCPWVDSNNPNEDAAKDFCSLLPPNLTYFCLEDINELWNLSIAFSEMRSSLRHLQTLIIDTYDLELHTFDPWLPCDILRTLEILANKGGNMDPGLFSSWPTDIPNNIKKLKFRLPKYGRAAYHTYDDKCLQKLPPHLTSLTLEGRCFRISPSFFESLLQSMTFLELSTRFTHQLRDTTDDEDQDGGDDAVSGKDSEDEENDGEEAVEEEFDYDDCLKDTVIVRHCPKHIELHMNCILTGAFFPPNVTKLKLRSVVELCPRPQQLPFQLRYCNFSNIYLTSNCIIIPDTLTELDFGRNEIDMELVSKIPNLQRLSGHAVIPMDSSTCKSSSLKSLRLSSSLDNYFSSYFGCPAEGSQTAALTSLQELELQSAWDEEATAYKLSQKFPNITSLKITDHKNTGKSHFLFPTVPNKTDGLEIPCSTTPQLPVLSKLQRLEVLGDELIITQSQLKHVTPNLTFLTIGSISIDNFTEILQSLAPGITKLTGTEIVKAICPGIITPEEHGGAPPKILFSGHTFDGYGSERDLSFISSIPSSLTDWTMKSSSWNAQLIERLPMEKLKSLEVVVGKSPTQQEISFPADCKALSQLETLILDSMVNESINISGDTFCSSLPRSLTKLELAPQVYVNSLAGLPQNITSLSLGNNITIDPQNASLLPPTIKTLRVHIITGEALGLLPTSLTRLVCDNLFLGGDNLKRRKRLIDAMKQYPSLSFFPAGVDEVFKLRFDDEMLAFYQDIITSC